MRTDISKAQSYIESLLAVESESKRQSRQFAKELGLERISVSPSEASLLRFLTGVHGCRKFVEIGTLTGLSAQYLIEGMPSEGKLWTLEKSPVHGEKAMQAWAGHPLRERIQLVIGDARATLQELVQHGPFDGVFIDGNKAAYGDYLTWSEQNVRKGGLIIADNVFLSGAVWGETLGKFSDKQILTLQEFNRRLSDPSLYESVIVPTVEGLLVAIKKF